jgi:uncharacterized damage-inducible protein DinB
MSLSESLLPEFDLEAANTRRTLERVPDDKLGWRPHPKSGTLGWLAGHVGNLPSWAAIAIGQDVLELDPDYKQEAPASRQEILAAFDKNVAAARAAIAGASDEKLLSNWTLRVAGRDAFTMPKVAVLRSFVMNHLIHHRAQLTVYLRLLDVPVPALYGPSADEGAL